MKTFSYLLLSVIVFEVFINENTVNASFTCGVVMNTSKDFEGKDIDLSQLKNDLTDYYQKIAAAFILTLDSKNLIPRNYCVNNAFTEIKSVRTKCRFIPYVCKKLCPNPKELFIKEILNMMNQLDTGMVNDRIQKSALSSMQLGPLEETFIFRLLHCVQKKLNSDPKSEKKVLDKYNEISERHFNENFFQTAFGNVLKPNDHDCDNSNTVEQLKKLGEKDTEILRNVCAKRHITKEETINVQEYTIIYQLLVHTFKDSDGDGVGDLKGVISKIDYFVDLGIDTIYLAPIFESTDIGTEYDFTDHCKIDSKYGTMEDFELLVKKLQELENPINIILDLIINYTNNKHEWFKKSIERIDPYTNFYKWENSITDGNDHNPPNDWISNDDKSAWTWNETRKQYYYHYFSEHEPDLNLENEDVKSEIKKIMKFWLDKGVRGFRINGATAYMENMQNKDDGQLYQDETLQIWKFVKDFVDDYSNTNDGQQRIIAAELYDTRLAKKYFRENMHIGADIIFNIDGCILQEQKKAYNFESAILDSLSFVPPGMRMALSVEDLGSNRIPTFNGDGYVDLLSVMSAMLPGVLLINNGQEIGMHDGKVPLEPRLSTGGNPNRTPMQWDSSKNAGFTTNDKPYLPANEGYEKRNVELQKKEKRSNYKVMKSMIDMKKTDLMAFGEFHSLELSDYVLLLWRTHEEKVLLAVFNFDLYHTTVNLDTLPFKKDIPCKIYTASVNSEYIPGEMVKPETISKFYMIERSVVVLSWEKST